MFPTETGNGFIYYAELLQKLDRLSNECGGLHEDLSIDVVTSQDQNIQFLYEIAFNTSSDASASATLVLDDADVSLSIEGEGLLVGRLDLGREAFLFAGLGQVECSGGGVTRNLKMSKIRARDVRSVTSLPGDLERYREEMEGNFGRHLVLLVNWDIRQRN